MPSYSDNAATFASLGRGPIAPAYLIISPDSNLAERASKHLLKRIFESGEDPFNIDSLHGDDATAADILQIADTLPMMVDRRAIVVKNFDKMGSTEQQAIADYSSDPCQTTTVILLAEKFGNKAKWQKEMRRRCSVVEFRSLRENDAYRFVRKECDRRQITISSMAVNHLISAVGTSMAQLERSIEKVDLFIGQGEGRRAEVEDVASVVADGRVVSAFELSGFVIDGDVGRALAVVHKLRRQRIDTILVLGALNRHIRILLLLREALDTGVPGNELLARVSWLNVRQEWVLNKEYLPQARRLTADRLRALHKLLFDADRALKSSSLSQQIILEQVVIAACRACSRSSR